jgi:bisphosphoglycerate-independent phosphoglycerate mutase (AlkP superfamily)
MTKLKNNLYTLVAHSGLPNAVETRCITTSGNEKKIRDHGGVIFFNYENADKAEYLVNYFTSEKGIAPSMAGGFSRKRVNGERIYVPTAEVHTKLKALMLPVI